MKNQIKNVVDVKLVTSIGALVAVLLIVSVFQNPIVPKRNSEKAVVISAFKDIQIEGQSAVVYNINTKKIIYEKDALSVRPLASVTKLMTALAASRALNNEGTIEISRSDVRTQGDSGLKVGEKFSFQKLVDFTLTISSNDGSEALASAAMANIPTGISFPENMNNLAREIGLKGLLFENPSGLDGDKVNAGAYGTALDVAKLLAYITKNNPKLISATRFPNIEVQSLNKIKHVAKNTNDAIAYIPGLIGGKTGYTDLSGGNLAVVFDSGVGNPYAVVVLGSSELGRFDDVRKLVSATFLSIEMPLQKPIERVQ
ncbi:MAG: serine hydrolase [Minisyncoccia bacterium]